MPLQQDMTHMKASPNKIKKTRSVPTIATVLQLPGTELNQQQVVTQIKKKGRKKKTTPGILVDAKEASADVRMIQCKNEEFVIHQETGTKENRRQKSNKLEFTQVHFARK